VVSQQGDHLSLFSASGEQSAGSNARNQLRCTDAQETDGSNAYLATALHLMCEQLPVYLARHNRRNDVGQPVRARYSPYLPTGRRGVSGMHEIAPCDAPPPTLTNVCSFQIGRLLIGVHRGPLWVCGRCFAPAKARGTRLKGTPVGCSAIDGFPGEVESTTKA
jgi:hypothetical protein